MITSETDIPQSEKNYLTWPLLTAIFILASGAMVFELVMGAVVSFILGDTIIRFSITIGLYLVAMGFGSFVSQWISNSLLDRFILIVLLTALTGGLSGIIIVYLFTATVYFEVVLYTLILLIGFLVGFEIPLLTRVLENFNVKVKKGLARVLFFDYLGSLTGAICFPLLLLPVFGILGSSLVMGLGNLFAGLMIFILYKNEIYYKKSLIFIIITGFTVLLICIVKIDKIESTLDQRFFYDKVELSCQTPYQKLIFTKNEDDWRLYINRNLQFCSIDEYRYHEMLVHPAVNLHPGVKKVLILGGGDGMASRELLKYSFIDMIDVVDIDAKVVEIFKSRLSFLNSDAMKDKRVRIHIQDARDYLRKCLPNTYDLVIGDLPDPNDEKLASLYSVQYFGLISRALKKPGIYVTQSTSPWFATESFWCINSTLKKIFPMVKPYQVNIPSFGIWGFQMASNFSPQKLKTPDIPVRYYSEEMYEKAGCFASDLLSSADTPKVNSIIRPELYFLYHHSQRSW